MATLPTKIYSRPMIAINTLHSVLLSSQLECEKPHGNSWLPICTSILVAV